MFATHARSVVSTVAPPSGRAPFRRSRAGAFARRARRRRSSSVRSSRVSLQTSPPFSRRRSSSSSPSSSFRGADVLPTLVAASPLVPQAPSRAPPPPRARTSPPPRVSSRRAFAAPPPRVVSRGPRARARRLVALPRRAAPPPPPSSSPPPPRTPPLPPPRARVRVEGREDRRGVRVRRGRVGDQVPRPLPRGGGSARVDVTRHLPQHDHGPGPDPPPRRRVGVLRLVHDRRHEDAHVPAGVQRDDERRHLAHRPRVFLRQGVRPDGPRRPRRHLLRQDPRQVHPRPLLRPLHLRGHPRARDAEHDRESRRRLPSHHQVAREERRVGARADGE